MDYLATTNQGNLWYISDTSKLKLLEYDKKSLFTGDQSLRFIKQIKDGVIVGHSDELLFFQTNYNPRIVHKFSLPGLIDIKDVAISSGGAYLAILSGLRDSVYIMSGGLKDVVTCFNINKEGELELFKDRQKQCNELPSNYFQIFYCPGMNNYHKFNRLLLDNDILEIISEENKMTWCVNLNDYSIKNSEYIEIQMGETNLDSIIPEEIITDYTQC